MKNIMIMLLGIGLSLSAFAGSPRVAGRVGVTPHGGVVVVGSRGYYPHAGFGYGYYSPFLSPYAYNSFYYPYGVYQRRPSKLDLDIQQINNDYHNEIVDVRHDKTLSGSDRRQQIRDLRHEKENTIIDAQRKYYHRPGNNVIK